MIRDHGREDEGGMLVGWLVGSAYIEKRKFGLKEKRIKKRES
jgi:hypothetical protein